MRTIQRPATEEMIAYFQRYVVQAHGNDLIEALRNASEQTWEVVSRIPAGFADHRYAPGKWSIKEIFQHLIDTERVFAYRALCFSRNEVIELPGFDENMYIENANTDRRELHELLREYDVVRSSTIQLFNGMSEEMLMRSGTANGNLISVRAIGWTIAGHVLHHMQIIDQRYLARPADRVHSH